MNRRKENTPNSDSFGGFSFLKKKVNSTLALIINVDLTLLSLSSTRPVSQITARDHNALFKLNNN